jgi:hypothetical protein
MGACQAEHVSFFGDDPVLRAAGAGGLDGGTASGGATGDAASGGSAVTPAGASGAGGDPVDAGGLDATATGAPPSASAGPNREATLGETVTIDDFKANDPDGDPLRVTWRVLAAPAGSAAQVVQPDAGPPRFTPDLAGTYTLHVTVTDGRGNATDQIRLDVCEAVVDAFPLPLSPDTSIFSDLDDGSAEVAFSLGFDFAFFGTTHASLHLNTNGGLTFGAGNDAFDLAAAGVAQPGIAVFWGDHDVTATTPGQGERANQLRFQQCPERFEVVYDRLQDIANPARSDSATVRLSRNGTIEIAYGDVLSDRLLVGVFDGTHADDRFPNPGGIGAVIESVYAGYADAGSGTILVDHFGAGPSHGGELSGRSVRFEP